MVARLVSRDGPAMLRDEGGRLYAYVFADTDRPIADYVADARRAVAAHVTLPPGYRLDWAGQFRYLERAKALCAACPVRLTCLALAVESQEYAGVWGGQIFERGRIVPHKRPRGRPRKHHVTPGRRPLSQGGAVPTSQASAPQITPQNRVDAAVRRLHDTESAVCAAHQSHVEEWITAANTQLRDAATEYLAATAAQNPAA